MKIISATATARFLTLFCISLLYAMTTAYSDDLKLEDGRILKNFKIINHSPKDAMVIHDGGADTVLLEHLPKELRKKYGYDEDKAEKYEKEKAKQDASYLEEQQIKREQIKQQRMEKKRLEELREQAEKIRFKVFNVGEDGLLVLHRKWRRERVWNSGRALVDGQLKTGYWKTISVEVPGDEVSFIIGYPSTGVVDGQLIDGYFTRIGTYSYSAVDGSTKTVKKLRYFPE